MELINKKYKKLQQIGEGMFGLIYKGENIRTRELVAIKVESIEQDTKLLKNESIIYQYLNNIDGIPIVKWFGKDDKFYYMVINLLGESLQSIINRRFNFSLILVLQIGIQIINILKTIHEKGLVHRDVKPDNFLLGLDRQSKKIHIIDFGFCMSYVTNNIHNKIRKTHNLIGSVSYASINAHNLIELSRRDDLESLGYMLIYFYLGSLPWQQLNYDNSCVKLLKQNIIENNNVPFVLIEYLKYIRSLEYDEKPNYLLIIDTFKFEIELLKKTN
jgi:casein kinase I family protein HRR25